MRVAVFVLLTGLSAACASAPPPPSQPPGDPLRQVGGEQLYQRGLVLARASHFVRAEQYFAAAIDRGMPEAEVLPALIRVCVASSRLRAALSHAEPYLRRNPSAWSLRYLVASLHLGLGDVERARAELERVVRDAPDQPEAHYSLALLLRDDVGDRAAAARHFASYLQLAPRGEHAAEVGAALESLRAEAEAESEAGGPAPASAPQPGTSAPASAPQPGTPAPASAPQPGTPAPASAPQPATPAPAPATPSGPTAVETQP